MNPTPPIRFAIALGVAIALTSATSAQNYHDSVVIVLDGSGSMQSKMPGSGASKMDVAKRALVNVLGQVPESTHIGLLVFNGQRGEVKWALPLGPQNAERMGSTITSLRSGGGTPLGKYMKIGADRLLEERKKQFGYGTYRLLIVTDGQAGDRLQVEQYTPDIVRKGIVIDVIGVAMSEDHTLANKVHSYRRADDPEALAQALAEVFAEVSTADDSSAALEDFQLLQGVPEETAYAMLSALTSPSNAPIGEKKPARVAPRPTRNATQSAQPSSRPQTRAAEEGGGNRLYTIVIVFGIIGIIVLTRKRRRRR